MGSNVNALSRFITKTVTDSITRPNDTTQYAVGDVIAEVTTNDHFLFEKVCQAPRYSGLVSTATIFSSANQSTKLDANLFLFAVDIGEDADNATWTPTDAELLTCLGVINFPAADWVAGNVALGAGGNAMCQVRNIGLTFKNSKNASYDDNRGVLYGVLVANNTYTPVANEVLTISLGFSED